MIDTELLEMLRPGNDVEVYFNHGNYRNEIRHIVAAVGSSHSPTLVVYMVWGRPQVEYLAQFQADFEGGFIRDVAGGLQ